MASSNLTFYWTGCSAKVDETAGEVVINTPPLRREVYPGMMKQWGVKPVRGLAQRFSGIRTIEDVNKFAAEYGLLGVASSEPERSSRKYFPDSPPKYTDTLSEPLSLWFEHAELLRRLLGLYRTLDRGNRNPSSDAEGKLHSVLTFEPRHNIVLYTTTDDGKTTSGARTQAVPFLNVKWAKDDKHVGSIVDEEALPLDSAAAVLAGITSRMLQGGIHLEYGAVVKAKDARLGYRISETHYTHSPLAAAYYDLWQMVTEGRPVTNCGNCGRVIEASDGREYCSNRCRQNAYDKCKGEERKKELAAFGSSHQAKYTWEELRRLWNEKGLGRPYTTTNGFQRAALKAIEEFGPNHGNQGPHLK